MQQIGSAVIATTMVLLAIFIPVGLIAGITGKIYQQFAVTIATAVVFSSVNALTLSPALCGLLLKQQTGKTGVFFTYFDKLLDNSKKYYMHAVTFLCKK